MSTESVIFKTCPDCREEYFTESVHAMTCSVKNPELTAEVKKELDKPGGINMEEVSTEDEDETETKPRVLEMSLEPTAAAPVTDDAAIPSGELSIRERTSDLDTEFNCSFCDTLVKQDADMDIKVTLKGLPVCSNLCLETANAEIEAEAAHTLEVNAAIKAYVELDRIEYAHKQFYKDRAAALARLETLIGVGSHFQDAAGTVYEIAPKKGQWVDFTPYEMHRTRRDTDASNKGSLALDRAEELGYEVERKKAKPKAKTAPDDPAPGKGGGKTYAREKEHQFI